ncbi:LEPR-XLL domain-containing protein [Acinetobacter proteolyticus]|nr:LEPR-XLL domain-containing protein [Acinetobacter proteolyticus]WEI17180.1 LEPR-XLL domain-containing protein [Acinetobacter proteolyticus]
MSNKEFNANTQEQMWTVEQLEPKLLLSADLMPGVHEISGHIEKPGEQKQYEFVVTEKTKFFFDGVNGEKFNWSLKGKEKGLNFSPISLEADAHKFLELLPDTYQLTVDGEDDKTGNYSFRIFGESAALNLNLNEATDLKLTPSTQAVLYKVQLDQGDRLYFDSQTSAVTWSMFDSNAKLIIDKSNLSKGFEATQSGTYWLSVEGNNSKNNVNSSFTLYSTKDSIDVLKLNEKQKVIFNKPYESKKYTFDLNQDQWIAYDQLSQGISDTEWLIEDNTGKYIFSNKQTENAETAPKFLKAGSYNLVFNSLANIQGEITFELKGSSVLEGNIDENNPNLTVGIDSSKFIKIKNKDNDSLALIFDNLIENIELKREEVISREVFFSNTGVQYYKVYLTKDDVVNIEKKVIYPC